MKYRKKAVVIEAFKWTADYDQTEDPGWIIDAIKNHEVTFAENECGVTGMIIDTLEGPMRAERGDYIIKGVHGELYSCKPDIFKETYEVADDD